jgi:hypothetical protein
MDVLEHELTPLTGIPALILTNLPRASPPRPVLRGGTQVDYLEGVAMGIVDPVVSGADPISIGIIKC